VFSDAARRNIEGEAESVLQVRQYLEAWCQRTGASLQCASQNMGLRRSIVSGVSNVLEKHNRVIVLEDDIVVSRVFLNFLNEALDAYASRADIVQISGNIVPHGRRLAAVGLFRMPGCWGWATWKRAWQFYDDDAKKLLSNIEQADTHAFDVNDSHGSVDALRRNAEGTLDTWFIRWYASVFLRGGLTLYPGISLTRNIGFDDQGTNCKPDRATRVFMQQKVNDRDVAVDWDSVGTREDPEFVAAIESFYRWQLRQWTKPSIRQRVRARLDLLSRRVRGD
jgi:hypothetical protein